jgi:hypothetical protein
MSLPRELIIKQGTDRTIVVHTLRDVHRRVWDPTGCIIHAVARSAVEDLVVAVWRSGTPGAGEGLAEVVNADPEIDSTTLPGEKWIQLYIAPEWSDTWTWTSANLDIEVRETVSPFRTEIFAAVLRFIPTTVRTA